jgi:histidinol-phosphate aminotransferase
MTIENMIRPHLKQFQPYRSARSEVRDAKIFLDANELSLGSPVTMGNLELNRYPDPLQLLVRKKLAERLRIPAEMIFMGSGSDEVIDLLIRLFCSPAKDHVVILEPTYGVYRVAANLNDVPVLALPLTENFQLDVDQILRTIPSSTKIVFCCSPNNPTGNLLRRDEILRLCRSVSALVVVDHAYIEFADASGDVSREVDRQENLIVLRTLSKAWGLAGIRLGYCIAHPAVISYLLRIKAPYNINAVTSHLALEALENDAFLASSVRNIVQERERLSRILAGMPGVVRVHPSDANFLLVEFRNAGSVYERFSGRGIIVRRRSEPLFRNSLRITVGTVEENNLLLQSIEENS